MQTESTSRRLHSPTVMMRLTFALLLMGGPSLGVAAVADAGKIVREGPVAANSSDLHVGELISDAPFLDLNGKPGRLSDFRDAKALVICMTGTGCPVARKYLPILATLEQDYRDRGVCFIVVNPYPQETKEVMRSRVEAAGFAGRYVPDPSAKLATILGATTSTEAFVLDGARTLQYRGAIDDRFGLGYARASAKSNYLTDAIDAVLESQKPSIDATTAPGCALDLKISPAAESQATPITYNNRISRIFQDRCLDCHRAGEAGPFTLGSYADVKGHAAMIRKVVDRGVMPPWFAGEASGRTFSNDRRLSDVEKRDLLGWIDAGEPEGDPKDVPIARTFVAGWKIGKPDAVFETPYAFQIPATGAMPYQRTVVATRLTEDKWVKAIEIRPTAPGVVHHVLVFVGYPPDHPRAAMQPRYDDGLGGYFAGLVPGQGAVTYAPGTAKFLPKDALLILQIHYTPNGEAIKDRPKIGMIFADKPPDHELQTTAAFNHRFRIPAGDSNYEVTAEHVFKKDIRLTALMPHTHVRGKAFRYELFYPDGRKEIILDVPAYDFNWQLEYQLKQPIDIPAGTKLKATAWYDNSENNPANPDPTKIVKFGDQTWEEMMIGYFSGYVLKPTMTPEEN